MPVSNAHLGTQVPVWDGKAQYMMDREEAKRLEDLNRLQITTNLSASQLKPADSFSEDMPPPVMPEKPKKSESGIAPKKPWESDE